MSSAKAAKNVVENVMFLRPTFLGKAPKFLWGICKSTPLPTYWPSLTEIPWLVIHLF